MPITAHSRPPRLAPGAVVALVAPAGAVSRSAVADVARWLRSRGFRVDDRVPDRRSGRFSAPDAPRAKLFWNALLDPDVDWVFCVRGGYGCIRLLDHLPPRLFKQLRRKTPKLVTGFSDVTLLHALLGHYAGWTTFHAPMAGMFNVKNLDQMVSVLSGGRLLCDRRWARGFRVFRRGTIEGVSWGGNMSLLQTLMGTPPGCPDFSRKRIIFLEDVDEPLYRIERMLLHLRTAGCFRNVAGVVFGRCERCPRAGLSMEAVLERVFGDLRIPVIYHYPFGHGRDNITIPLGRRVRLDGRTGELELCEAAVHAHPRS